MVFKTAGSKSTPVILFFHAMGVTGESSMPVAEKMAEKFYCVMPTSAQMILDLHAGNWEIKFNENNTGAKKLWEKITSQYKPNVYHINDEETVLEFSNK